MRKLAKNKLFTGFVAMATILWTVGIVGILIPLFPAQAAVTVVSENRIMSSWTMGGGMMADLADFKITASAAETLNSIKVRFEDIGSSGATPGTMLAAFNAAGAGGANDQQGLSVIKDANSNGWFDPGTGMGDTVLAWENQPTWTDNGNGTYDTVLDIVNDALPASYTGNWNYFVYMKMAAAPASAQSFKFTFLTGAGNAIATSGTSPSITQFSTQAINSAGSGGGSMMPAPHVRNLYYRSYKTLIVEFDRTMQPAATECVSPNCADKYVLKTKNATDDETIASAALVQGDATRLLITANNDTRISLTPEDYLTISSNPQYAPKDATNSMPYSDNYPVIPMIIQSDLKITEIKISGTLTTDEFIEIENTGNTATNINGYTISALMSSGTVFATLATASNVTLNPGQYYLFANQTNNYYMDVNGLGMSADQPFTAGGVNLASGDTIFLTGNDGYARDLVGIGNTMKVSENASITGSQPANGSFERKAFSSSTAATMASADATKANAFDSNNNDMDFVLATTAGPEKSTSTLGILIAQGGYTNSIPTIEHMPVSMAVAGQSLTVPAKIFDGEDSFTQFQNVNLCYKATNVTWPGSPTCVNGVMGYQVTFNIPGSAISSAGLDYYIYVKDSMNGEKWSSANTSATSAVEAKAAPFQVTVSNTSGSKKISGTVYASDGITTIANASVFVEGAGYSAVSGNDGTFTITGLPDGVYNLSASAGGYISSDIWGISVNANNPQSVGWKFFLHTGHEAQGGDGVAPRIKMTTPSEGMKGAPVDIVYDRAPILIYFDQQMDPVSIACDNCNAASANIKLKKISAGTTTNITGYNIGVDTGSGVQGIQHGGTTTSPVAVLWMTALLTKATDYVVEVTSAVKDLGQNSVEGNRPGGGHSFMFTTQDTDFNFGASAGGFGFTENESFWQGGNFTSMTGNANYQTMTTKYDTASGKWQGGQFNPPYIMGATPVMGQKDIALNLDGIYIKFSEAMDSNSINKGAINLFSVVNGTATDVTSTKVSTVSLSADKMYAIVDLVDNALSSGVQYRLKIKNGVRGASGLTIGPPADPGGYFYESDFTAGTASDATAASVLNSYPDNDATNVSGTTVSVIEIMFNKALNPTNVNSNNVSLKAGTTIVPTKVDYDLMSRKILIIPTSGLSPGVKYTITITLGGSTGIKDMNANPASSSTLTRSFTMSTTVDVTNPRVEFANCDTYGCAITFSKPMNALKASDAASNASMWTSSVLNPANYTITYGADGTGSTANAGATGVSIDYDYQTNTVMIDGLAFTGAAANSDSFVATVSTNAADLMNNSMLTTANSAKGILMNASDMGGFKGPATGGMMGMGPMAVGGPSDFGMYKPQEAIMMGANAMPMNMVAGASTTFMIDFPVFPSGKSINKLNDGAYFKFTFPKGFNVANVIPDPNNPSRNDLNWGGPSTVVLKTSGVADDGSNATTKGGAANDGVTVSGQTVTVWLNTNAGETGDPDFFHLELKTIVNTSVVQDFNSSGYTIDMKSYKANGIMAESKSSMPFFINSTGTNNITVNLSAQDGNGSVLLMMGGPSTGPMDSTVTISSGTGTQTWNNLPDGCYHLFTEPTITLGSNKYSGQNNPEPICLPGSGANWNSGTKTLTKGLSFTKLTGANTAQLTVKISGTFSASGENVDIFAGGPNSFSVETKTLTGSVTNNSTTLFLPVNGNYMVGIGPAMPKGPMMGAPPMPDWMPPMSININVSGIGGTPVIKRTDTNQTITELSFTVNSASKQIIGRVISKETTLASGYTANATSLSLTNAAGFSVGDYIVLYDGTNADSAKITNMSGSTATIDKGVNRAYAVGKTVYNVIPNASVHANQPMGFGGKGAYMETTADGAFILKVASNGSYEIGAWKPGIGEAPFRTVTVSDNNAATADNNSTADVKVDGQLVTTANPLLVKMYKPGYTISGKVMDASLNPIQYTHLMAEEATSHQIVHSGTDSNGAYVLNVDLGVWTITAEMPPNSASCGTITKTVTIDATGSKDFQNLTPSGTICYSVSGTVTINGVAQANVPVMFDTWDSVNNRPAAGYHRNETTDSTGNYLIKAGNGTYRVGVWTPDFGEVGTTVVVNGANATANITYAANAMKTLTITFTGGTSSMHGFAEAKSTTGMTRRGMPLNDLSQATTINLPADIYKVMVYVDGMGDFSPASNVDMSASNQAVTIDLSGQSTHTLTGTVLDNSNNPISGAAVVIVNSTTGLSKQTTTDASGNYSMTVKDGSYNVRADHKDYSSPAAATVSVAANTDYDFDSNTTGEDIQVDNDLVLKSLAITGTINESDATPINSGFVYATKSTGEKTKAAIQQDGTYSLAVSSGEWTVKADGPLHALTTMSSTVTVSDSSAANKNITLTADAADIKKSDSRTVSVSGGAAIDDSDNTGVEFTVGQNVLGQGTSGTVIMEEVDMPDTDTLKPVGNFVEISAKVDDNDVSKLTGDGGEIQFHYTDAELTAAGVTNEALLSLSYYDDTTDSYMPLSNMVCDAANNVCSGNITHLTPVGITKPYTTATTTTVRRQVDSGAAVVAPVAETPKVEDKKVVVEKKKAVVTEETKKEVVVKEEVKAETKKIVEAPIALVNVVPAQPAARELKKEIGGVREFIKLVKKTPATDKDWSVIHYLAYGTTDKIKSLDVKNRVSLLDDYKKIYGKMPANDAQWNDLAKIAQGETPTKVLAKETEAAKVFVKIFKRAADSSSAAEQNFVERLAYQLRTQKRDLSKEKAAIKQYASAYKALPASHVAWAVVHAIAYSGASKEEKAETAPKAEEKLSLAPIANAVPVAPATQDRNLKTEISAIKEYTKLSNKTPNGTGWDVVNFISYGSTDASKLKSFADRAKVVKQFKAKYGKLPSSESDWQKMAELIK